MDATHVASSNTADSCKGEISAQPATLRHHVLATAVYVAITLGLTWPLVLNMGSKVPLHPKLTILAPYYHLYVLAWNHHAFDRGLKDYWDANIYYPHPSVLSYFESLPTPSVMTWPIHRVTHNITLCYNVVVLSAFVLTALGAYTLCLQLGSSWRVALLAGGAMAFCPYIFGEIYCLGTLLIYPAPFFLASLHRLIRRPTWPGTFATGACGVWLATTYAQYALFCAFFAVVWMLWFVHRIPWRRLWYRLLVVGLLCGSLILPMVVTIQRTHRQMGFHHGPTLPMTWPQMFVPASHQRLYRDLLGIQIREHREDLDPIVCFPGLTFGLLAAIGAYTAIRSTPLNDEARFNRHAHRFYLLASLTAVLLAMGLWIRFGPVRIPGPYGLLYLTLPPFSSVRSVYRFFIFGQLFASVLMAVGLDRCLSAISTSTGKRIVGVSALLLLTIESLWIPLNLQPIGGRPTDVHPLYAHLAKSDPSAPLIELPVPASMKRAPLDVMYTLNSAHTWQPLVNGHASYIPGLYDELRPVMESFPGSEGIRHLQALGVKYVIVRAGLMPAERLEAIKEFSSLQEVMRDGRDVLYRLDNSTRRSLNEWTGKTSLQLDVPRPGARTTVAQVVFDLDLREVIPVLPGDRCTRWKLIWGDATSKQVLAQSVAVRDSHWLTFKKNKLGASVSLPKNPGSYTLRALDEITGSDLGSCKVEVR